MRRIESEHAVDSQFVDARLEPPQIKTPMTVEWLNDVQEELCNVIEATGLSLGGLNLQFLAALERIKAGQNYIRVFKVPAQFQEPTLVQGIKFDFNRIVSVQFSALVERSSSDFSFKQLIQVSAVFQGNEWVIDEKANPKIITEYSEELGASLLITPAGQLMLTGQSIAPNNPTYRGFLSIFDLKTVTKPDLQGV